MNIPSVVTRSLLVVLGLLPISALATRARGQEKPAAQQSAIVKRMEAQPLHFEPTEDGRYTSRSGRNSITVGSGGSIEFLAPGQTALRMSLVGADESSPAGDVALPGRTNYLIGNDSSRWRPQVSQFAKARVNSVYPGVDVVYYGNGSALEHDYLVHPGANASDIRMSFANGSATLDGGTGDLLLERRSGDAIRMRRPVAYQQDAAGARHEIAAGYQRLANGTVGFQVGEYDHSRELVIDPVILYSSYFGGNYNDSIIDMKVAGDGSLYLLLTTDSTNLKSVDTTSGACIGNCGPGNQDGGSSTQPDMYVAKLDSNAQTLLFSTYLGGSGSDQAYNLALDSDGSVYVAGTTRSTDFPVVGGYPGGAPVNGGNAVGTLTKLSADGSTILYSTYIGYGLPLPELPPTVGNAAAHVMVTANHGIVYLLGQAGSTDAAFVWQTANPLFTVGTDFLAKLDTTKTGTASVVYATRVGDSDSSSSNSAQVTSVALDSKGDVWLYGETKNSAFPIATSGALQTQCNTQGGSSCLSSFLMELDPTGASMLYATYLGGSGGSNVTSFDIQLDATDTIYLAGYTDQTNYPILNGAYTTLPNGAMNTISKISSDGKTLLYSTFIQSDIFSVGTNGKVGFTIGTGAGFPLVNNLPGSGPSGGNQDAAFGLLDTTLSGTNSLLLSSYLGTNTGNTQPQRAYLASTGQLLIMGETTATDLPVPNAYQSTSGGGGYDGFLAIIQTGNATTLTLTPSTLNFPSTVVGSSSAGMTATLYNGTAQAISLSQATLTDSNDFTITSTSCGGTVSTGQSCVITFVFTPKSAATLTATYSIANQSDPSQPLEVTLSGTGTGTATAALSPTALDFGTVASGTPKTSSVTLTNSGPIALAISNVSVTGTGFAATQNQCGSSLAANSSCQISITATATTSGAMTGTLTIVDAAGTQTAALTATGSTTPTDTLSPNPLNFGSVSQSQTGLQIATFSNTGTQPVTITGMPISPSTYSVSRSTCPTPVPAGQSCAIYLQFHPVGFATTTGTFTVEDGVSNPSITLTATGVQDPSGLVTLTPNALNFSNVAPGQTSGPQVLTLTNKSTTAVQFTQSEISIAGTDAGSFSFLVDCDPNNGCNPVYYNPAQPTVVTYTVNPGGTFLVNVTMGNDAQDLKTYTANLSIDWNYVGALSTTTPGVLVSTITGNTLTPAAPSVTPTSISFPITANGSTSAAQSVIVSNSGDAPLGLTSVTLTGTNPTAFTQMSKCPATFNKGDTCTISVAFAPPASGQSFTGTLDVKLSTGDVNVALTGSTSNSDFTVTSSSGTQTNPGASWAIAVAPMVASVGWDKPVTFTVSGLDPSYGTPTFTPASVTPGGVTAITTLTLVQASPSAHMKRPMTSQRMKWPMLACFTLFLGLGARLKSIRGQQILMGIACVTLGGLALAGCGNQQAPVNFTVTATSGSVSHTLELTFQPPSTN